jgi:hypothetical protein
MNNLRIREKIHGHYLKKNNIFPIYYRFVLYKAGTGHPSSPKDINYIRRSKRLVCSGGDDKIIQDIVDIIHDVVKGN